ncbi:MAG: hypothetical protein V4613_10065 [Bacteroidota bacterium]
MSDFFNKFVATMKLFALVLLSIVLSLSLVPCCTNVPAIAESSGQITSGSCCSEEKDNCEDSPTENEGKGCTVCSPFFSCGSCIGFTFYSFNYHFTITEPFTKSSFQLHDTQVNSEYFNKMWQPPKLG